MTPKPASVVPTRVGLPPPDSPGGLAVLGAVVLGLAYVILLVGDYSALCAEALWVVSLNLVLGVVASFFLISLIASDRARATDFELEFARTVQAHLAAGETLVEASPLGGILRAYARAAQEQRNSAREHSYAAGPALGSAGLALVATLMVGLGDAVGSPPDLIGVAMLVELAAFVLLSLSAGLLAFSVGRGAEVVEFDALVLRRWRGLDRPSFPFSHSLSEVPWAVRPGRDAPPPAWLEPVGSSSETK